jgi:chemotaxis protein methyltransferase CheR
LREDDQWKIQDDVRALVTFRNLNLIEQSYSFGDKVDIILCRNVAIYFTEHDRKKLFGKVARILDPEGALIIGSTESITGYDSHYESKRYLRTVYYQLKPT